MLLYRWSGWKRSHEIGAHESGLGTRLSLRVLLTKSLMNR